jgi:hypothetical protein
LTESWERLCTVLSDVGTPIEQADAADANMFFMRGASQLLSLFLRRPFMAQGEFETTLDRVMTELESI